MTKPIDIECISCDKNEIKVIEYSDTVDFRGAVLEVKGLKEYYCHACQSTWHDDAQTQHNYEVKRVAYSHYRDTERARLGLLSSEEISLIRNYFDLNQRQASLLFGGGTKSFSKYETGEVLQSSAMDRLIRIAFLLGDSFKDLLQSATQLDLSNFKEKSLFGSFKTHTTYNPKLPPNASYRLEDRGMLIFSMDDINQGGETITVKTRKPAYRKIQGYETVSIGY